MPAALRSRWQCALTARAGWNAPGYDSTDWQTVATVPGRYLDWMDARWQSLMSFMWHPAGANTGRQVYFRRSLWLPGHVVEATINVAADDQFMLYVNGRGVGQSRVAHQDNEFNIAPYLRTGPNVIALQAMDVQPPGYGLLVVPQIRQTWPPGDGAGWRCPPASQWDPCGRGSEQWPQAAPDAAPPIKLRGYEEPFACLSVPGGMKAFSTAYFYRPLDLDGVPLPASITVLGDDGYELFVNGRLVAVEKRPDRAYWPQQVNVADLLHPGRNHLALKVTNDWGPGRMYCVPTVTMTL